MTMMIGALLDRHEKRKGRRRWGHRTHVHVE